MTELDVVSLVLRVWAGIVMIAHGLNHARTQESTARWFASKGFKSPELNAKLSAGNELLIGAALIVGLLTSVAAAGLAATMFVAFWAIHRFAGFFVFHRPDEGYEYVITMALVALGLAMIGPGSASLDAVLGIADDLDGWTGAAIVGAGFLLAMLQLAAMWRRPAAGESAS